jgi:hypothetical protein
MSSSYFQGTIDKSNGASATSTGVTGDDEHDHYENLSFFCSLMCFVPWSQVISLTCHEHEHEEIPSSDEIILDDYSIHSQGITSSSSLNGEDGETSQQITLMSLSNTDSSWSVFKSRRRNSGNVIKDFRETPTKVRPKGGHMHRTSPTGVNRHPQYFDLRGI